MDDLELFGISPTIVGSKEWEELIDKEQEFGPEFILDELLEKRNWSNVEIAWVLKRMMFFYGKKDALLTKAPIDRIMLNLADVLRVFYLLIDYTNPELDDNMRSYISTKLADATWGINSRTRNYLTKL
ncbi:MAG: hypothetical protein GX333_05140 [Syntrophomonadaceae bacterium]|nr:hypothetical protein [Syntrophomonadaceae bacterium]